MRSQSRQNVDILDSQMLGITLCHRSIGQDLQRFRSPGARWHRKRNRPVPVPIVTQTSKVRSR